MYKQKILHFFCRPCGDYHLKTHPHYRAMKRRKAKRKAEREAIPTLGISETVSEIPEKLRKIMRNNSQAVEELLTKKAPC